jgi:N-acetylneuraminic acid mutarotase
MHSHTSLTMQQKGILGSLLLIMALGILLILTLLLLYGSLLPMQTKPAQTTATQNTVPLEPFAGGTLTATLTSSNQITDSGGVETLTVTMGGGSLPYTVNFFNVTGNRLLLSEISYPWASANPYPINDEEQSCAISSNNIYCIGGYNFNGGGIGYNATYYAPILGSNVLGAWTSTSPYPTNDYLQSCAATSNSIYCIGGYNNFVQEQSAVYYAPILDSGGLGPWVSSASPYPTNDFELSCVATSNSIYCIGGISIQDGPDSAVYYAPILGTGALGTWTRANPYHTNVYGQSCVVSSNNIYCMGGFSGAISDNAVYYAQILGSNALGTWTSTNSYPTNGGYQSCVATSNNVYCIAGYSDQISEYTDSVYYAPILGSGALGAWTSANSFPENDVNLSCLASPSNNVYCIGGIYYYYDGPDNSVYYTPVLSSGTLATNVPLTYTFTTNTQIQGEVFQYNVVVTDPAPATISTTNSITVTFPTIALKPSTVDISNGQTETLTATITGGIPPYAVKLFNITGGKNAQIFGYQKWLNTSSYPNQIDYPSCTAYGNSIYCIGGYNNSFGSVDATYHASVSRSGGLGPWAASANSYPTNDEEQSCVTSSNNIYCIGGMSNQDGLDNATYYAPILVSGIPGEWTATSPYPTNVYSQSCITSSGKVYCMGGISDQDGYDNATYYAPILGSGALGTWTSTNSYPTNDGYLSCADSSNNVYCIGGYTVQNGIYNATYYAPILDSGGLGPWVSSANPYPVNVTAQKCLANSNYIYCTAGYNNSHDDINKSYYAPILGSGDIGAWSATASYPFAVDGSSCVTISNSIYCVGGENMSDYTVYNNVYYAPLSDSGIANTLTYAFTANSAVVNYALQFNASVIDSGIPYSFLANSISNTIIINPSGGSSTTTISGSSSTVTSTTTILGSSSTVPSTTTVSGGASTGGGPGEVGNGGSSEPVIIITNSIYNVSNIAQLNAFNISPNGIPFKVTDNYINPNSTGVTINGTQYLLFLNRSVLIKNTTTTKYYAKLVVISYVPISHTVNIYFYSNSTVIPPPVPIINSTSTVLPIISTSQATSSTIPATMQSSNKSEDSAIAIAIIVILILLMMAYLYTRKHKKKGKEKRKKQEIVSV